MTARGRPSCLATRATGEPVRASLGEIGREPELGLPWRFWLIEALAMAAALVAVPAVSRLERRHQFGYRSGIRRRLGPHITALPSTVCR